MRATAAAVVIAAALLTTGCSGDEDVSDPAGRAASDPTTTTDGIAASATVVTTSSPPPTVAGPTVVPTTATPSTSTTVAGTVAAQTVPLHPNVEIRSAEPLTRALSDDLLTGRDNGTLGSELAQQVLTDELSSFAEPLLDGFEQPFAVGTNLLAVVPGTDLADEYVMIGAHYDHLGDTCRFPTATDVVCNGAADNAAGVAVAVEAARAVADIDPRRSVVIALWDAEEDGLLGSRAFVADPPFDLDRVVAYLNTDLLGANLLPSLAGRTMVIGAETGGAEFDERVSTAMVDAGVAPVGLSLVFGQGRSDHAPFAKVGVPVVFFSDQTNGCYHTVDDEIDRVDVDKLDRELRGVTTALVALSTGELTPERTATPPFVSFDDVVALRDLVRAGEPDLDLLGAAADDVESLLDVLDRTVDEGAPEFDGADAEWLLRGAGLLLEALATQGCPA